LPAPSRDEALRILEDGQARLLLLFSRLSDDELTRPSTIGGGDWSAKDLIGHIAFVEEIALVTAEAWLRGERPPIAQTFTSGDTDDQNAWNQARKRAWPIDRVREDSETTHRRLVASIDAMTESEWATPRPFDGDELEWLGAELGGVLGAPDRPFGHDFAHLPDLDAYARSLGR
jgi:hypothetical protein